MNPENAGEPARLFTPKFIQLCTGSLLFSASFSMILPELPAWLEQLGGKEFLGWIVALFTVTAGLSRPVSGKLADTIGRKPVMMIGAIVCLVCSCIYPFVSSVAGFLLLRLVHGGSTGFTPTGVSAYMADIAPVERRGEGMSWVALFNSLGMSAGPMLGSYLAVEWNFTVMFFCSSLFGMLALLIVALQEETLAHKVPFQWKLLLLQKNDIFQASVWPVFVVTALTCWAIGFIQTLMPAITVNAGFTNKGIFFALYTASSLLARLTLGKLTDRFSRITILKFTSFGIAASLFLLQFATSQWVFIAVALLYGITWALNTPTLVAWTVDISDPENRGRALATTYLALEIGIGLGAFITGYLYAHQTIPMTGIVWLSSALSMMAFAFLLWKPFRFKTASVG
jgi:MFS family permease